MSDQASPVWPPRMPAAIRLAARRLIVGQVLVAVALVVFMPRWPAIPGIREILWLTVASVPLTGAGLLITSRWSQERAGKSRMAESWNGVLVVVSATALLAGVSLWILAVPLTDGSRTLLQLTLVLGSKLGLLLTLNIGSIVITEPLRAAFRMVAARVGRRPGAAAPDQEERPKGMRRVRAKPPMGRFDLEAWRQERQWEPPFNLEATRLERYPGT